MLLLYIQIGKRDWVKLMSKKCIGIITFNRAVNYGAILQCFALHKALNKLKINNEVIDYYCESREKINTLKY